ncbi:hypothetical protein M513_08044 [Trichuris suis]|uniref:Uncharacterized protein n=1 Tax=Trichuris suis TaxID=68888 RepID=A0A085M1A7_9BILA|nr:hypothetical protein M513_08044 [Trichuris suis]
MRPRRYSDPHTAAVDAAKASVEQKEAEPKIRCTLSALTLSSLGRQISDESRPWRHSGFLSNLHIHMQIAAEGFWCCKGSAVVGGRKFVQQQRANVNSKEKKKKKKTRFTKGGDVRAHPFGGRQLLKQFFSVTFA